MTLPRWNDSKLKAGTKVRTALWLISEIGVGNSFTKEQHRAAFPGVAQADRRLRDLRSNAWVIHTSAEDVTLNPDEQRFVSMGDPVWDRGSVRKKTVNALTAKMRRATFADSDYQCSICGIAGGEKYADAPHTSAVLSVSRRAVKVSDGDVQTMFVTECNLCRSGARAHAVDVAMVLAHINALSTADRSTFLRWAGRGRRDHLDQVWAEFRRLPKDVRREVAKRAENSS